MNVTKPLRRLAALMAATLAAPLGLCALSAAAHADTLIDNVDGMRFERDGKVERFVALLIDDDGRVKKLYSRKDKLPKDADYRLDGEGRVLVPGFIDSHAHLSMLGFKPLTLDLSGTTSLDEARARIADYAARYPNRAWIVGSGWNQESWGLGRFPTAAEIDDIVGDRPVYLKRTDDHAVWVNSAALKAAGIDAKTKNPAGGKIERDPSGKATGLLIDKAVELIAPLVPAPRPEERDLAFQNAQQTLLKNGITGVADMLTTMEDWQTMRRAGDLGRLRIRVMSYADGTEAMVAIAGPGPTPWLYGDRLRMGGVKLFLDGSLGSRGAWLLNDYADAPGQTGIPQLGDAQLRNLMSRAAMAGFQPAVHAIGDAANREVLNAIEELNETYKGDRRWRIEHAQVLAPEDIARIAKLGAVASMQPLHQPSDRLMAEARLGPDRLSGAYAWQSLIDADTPLAFGSDAPVEPADVIAGIAAAVTRQGADGEPFGGWQPQERISRERALAAFTAGAAWAGQADGRFGTLAPGEWADFVFLSADPLLQPESALRDIEVLETWVAGVRQFRQGE